jgi:hypothetical protein
MPFLSNVIVQSKTNTTTQVDIIFDILFPCNEKETNYITIYRYRNTEMTVSMEMKGSGDF